MDTSTKSVSKTLLRGLAYVLFAIAGLSFWAGGKLISESWKIDRILAEMIGLVIAAACGALGYGLKTAGEPDEVEEDPDPTSGDSAFRE